MNSSQQQQGTKVVQVGQEDNFAPYNQVNKLLSTIRSKLEHLHARAAVTQVTKTLA